MCGESEACFIWFPQVKKKFSCMIIAARTDVIDDALEECN